MPTCLSEPGPSTATRPSMSRIPDSVHRRLRLEYASPRRSSRPVGVTSDRGTTMLRPSSGNRPDPPPDSTVAP
jgi:hypothetical protein